MDPVTTAFWLPLLEIIWIDILLSGDNAVVVALACRSLPERQRTLGIMLGSGAAVAASSSPFLLLNCWACLS